MKKLEFCQIAKTKTKIVTRREQEPIWILGKIKAGKPMGLSKEDQAIYGE